ncbi:MAG: outer membrane protein assembly factor [Halanaerobiales bacterium]
MIKKLILSTIIVLILLSINVAAQEGLQVITDIEVEGTEEIAEAKILPLIETQVGELMDVDKIKADQRRIYDSGNFRDVTVSFEPYNGGLRAIFQVVEYPVINDIIIEGNQSYSDEKILSLLKNEKGKVFNFSQLNKSAKEIIDLYHSDGYIIAGFNDLNISEEGILTLKLNEGYINDIIIKGNNKTKDDVILRELIFSEGDILNKEVLQKSLQKVFNLGLFNDIKPDLEPVEDKDNTVNIIVEVEEGKTANFLATTSWSSKDGWIGSIDLSENNLLGNGQTLAFNWKFGGVTNYSLSFHEPWLLDTETSFGISIYDKHTSGTDSEDGDYLKHRYGGYISLGRPLYEDWKGKVRLRIEDSTIEWVDDKESDDPVVSDTQGSDLRSLAFQFSRDTTDHPFNPTEGRRDIFSIEYAGQMLGGGSNFTKYDLDLRRYYQGFREDHTFAVNLNAGTATGDMPALEKYRIGGSGSLRGYKNGTFAGRDMLLLKLEYRIAVTDDFTGVIFTDAGNVWDEDDDIDLGDLHSSYGAGIRMNTFIGQIRLDYAFNEDGEGQTHFGLGHSF